MKLISLQIERFGARSNLQLDHLSDRLNVVYGPNGSGKTTIIQFIRWMLYGSQDSVSQRYVNASDARVGGAIVVRDGSGRTQTVSRHLQGAFHDQVRITGGEVEGAIAYDPRRLTGVDVSTYHHLYSFGFDQPQAIESLVRVAQANGFGLAYEESQMQRLRELTQRLDELRRTAGVSPTDERSLAGLLERKRQIQIDWDATERRRVERIREYEREVEQLQAEIVGERRHADDLEATLRRIDAHLAARTRQADEASDALVHQRERWLDQRRQELARIDEQIQHWHQTLDLIRRRHESLQTHWNHAELPPVLEGPLDEAELRAVLRSLGHAMDDIEQDMRDVEGVDDAHDERLRTDYLRSVLAAAWQSMRNDVQRLCRELQRQRVHIEYHEHSREVDHLRRCEAELLSMIEMLDKRRASLRAQPEMTQADLNYSQTNYVSTPPLGFNGQTTSVRPWGETRSFETRYESRGSWEYVNGHGVRGREMDPVWEARLAHLARRREHVVARVREVEGEIIGLEQRRDALQSRGYVRDEERHLETLRVELQQVEERIRQLETWQRRRDEIEALERQIEQMRQQLAPSEILREATQLLVRLTEGACRAMRITDRAELWVEDDRGHAQVYQELSRGTRDQAYLALALALVAALRRRGVELPMALNDLFINIDADRTQATIEVLNQFANQGHQILVFTHQEPLTHRFSQLQAKLYSLRERTRPLEPTPTELYVRPVPRTDLHYLDQPAPPYTAPSYVPAPIVAPLPEPLPRAMPQPWATGWEPTYRQVGETRSRRERPVERPLVVREAPPESPRPVLTDDSLLLHVDVVDPAVATRLRELHIETVRQFRTMDAAEMAHRLGLAPITPAVLERWQAELTLQVFVGLSTADASLLVACGIEDPEGLAYIDVSELHRRIEAILAGPEARARFGSIARFERSRLARWIQAARRSHFRREPTPTNRMRPTPPARPAKTPEPTAERPARTRRVETPRSARATVADAPAVAEPRPEARVDERREPLRFFLAVTDPIVDAPSIGPKTAERFQAIGIDTVEQLLDIDSRLAAERINYRRITADLIQSWQKQTELVCRVPNLRGHDAQILVACGIQDADQLARQDPAALVALVDRFVQSAEGKRTLRGAKLPDASEVGSWIRWARNARRR